MAYLSDKNYYRDLYILGDKGRVMDYVSNYLLENNRHPFFYKGDGTKDNPYFIQYIEDLFNISYVLGTHRNDVNYFKLVRGLNFNRSDCYRNKENKALNRRVGFMPIPIASDFISLEGENHTIRGLRINRSGIYQGLFYALYQGLIIKNLKVEDFEVIGCNRVGSLFGQASYAELDNLHLSGRVVGQDRVCGIGNLEFNPLMGESSCHNVHLDVDVVGDTNVHQLFNPDAKVDINNTKNSKVITLINR